jgi:hypothetical protein
VNELRDLSDLFERGDTVACGVSARMRARLGISEELVSELQAEYVKRLCSGEPSEVILRSIEARMSGNAARSVPRRQ